MRKLAALAMVVALWITMAAPAGAQTAAAGCQFVLGFRALHELHGVDTGECVDNQSFAANGDALQHTTKGLLVWRKADNWTAFTDGYRTWINGPAGLATRLNTDRFPWEASQSLAVVAPAATPAPAAAPQAAPTKLLYSWYFKRVSEAPSLCGNGQNGPCVDSAPNAGTQYIAGHVFDSNGAPVSGIIVHARWGDNIQYSTSGFDGAFNITIGTGCPKDPRKYDVYVVDDFSRLSSYVKTVNYIDCNVAGEFHFDFVHVA